MQKIKEQLDWYLHSHVVGKFALLIDCMYGISNVIYFLGRRQGMSRSPILIGEKIAAASWRAVYGTMEPALSFLKGECPWYVFGKKTKWAFLP